jgi:hypothetical protein
MKGIALLLCFNLLLGNLLPNKDLHELSEIMTLMEHYHDHASHGHDVGILDFVLLHYADDAHEESGDHEKLPFHHTHPDTVASSFVVLMPAITFGIPHDVLIEKQKFFFQQQSVVLFPHSIWQPPKI